MTYGSTDSTALLANPRWRIQHSLWMLAVFLGVGMLSFVGFVYCAIRVKNRKFWLIAAGMSLLSAAMFVIAELWRDPHEDTISDGGTGVMLAIWATMIIVAFLIKGDYLRWRAGVAANRSMGNGLPANAGPYSSPYGAAGLNRYAPPQQRPLAPAPIPAPGASPFGVSTDQYFASGQPMPSPAPTTWDAGLQSNKTPLNINDCAAEHLVSECAIDSGLANRIVETIRIRGGFRDIDDLASAIALQPHQLVRLRGKVSFEPAPQAPPSATRGRVLDF